MDNDNGYGEQPLTPPEPKSLEPKPEQQPEPDTPPSNEQPDQQDQPSQDPPGSPSQTPPHRADYNKSAEAYAAGHKRRPYGKIIVIAIMVLAIAAAAAYWFLIRQKPAAKKTPAKTTSSQTPASASKSSPSASQPAAAAARIDSTTKQYSSTPFKLSFDYPANWAISDPGAGILTATSPALQLTDASGQSVNGQIVMTIRDKDQLLPEFDSGAAVAVLKSVQITYAKPSPTQRKSTYISFLQYASTTTHGALDGVYITGNNGYKYQQAIPKTVIAAIDPRIDITFFKCADSKCSAKPTALSIEASAWSDTNFSGPLENMLKSLSIT